MQNIYPEQLLYDETDVEDSEGVPLLMDKIM